MPEATIVASLELFHSWADEAGWVLESDDGRIALEGRVRSPALPGPSQLLVEYLDAPTSVVIDGVRGSLSVRHAPSLSCRALGDGRAHVTGTLALQWTPASGGLELNYALAIDLAASLVT